MNAAFVSTALALGLTCLATPSGLFADELGKTPRRTIKHDDGVPIIKGVKRDDEPRQIPDYDDKVKPPAFTTEGPKKFRCHVRYPENYDPSNPPGLIVLIPPKGNGKRFLDIAAEGLKSTGWIGVGVDSYLEEKIPPKKREQVFREILASLEKHVRFDSEELYVGGIFRGAFIAYTASATVDRKFKGLLIMQGWILPNDRELEFAEGMRVAQVNGSGDTTALSREEEDRKILRQCRSEAKSFPFNGRGPNPPPKLLRSAMIWMKTGKAGLTAPVEPEKRRRLPLR